MQSPVTFEFVVVSAMYNKGTVQTVPFIHLCLTRSDLDRMDKNSNHIDLARQTNSFWVYLNHETFNQMMNQDWDGSYTDAERVIASVKGKTVTLALAVGSATFTSCYCGAPATWVRHTQFAGNHPFCTEHAEQESDFGREDPSYFYWERLLITREEA